VSSNKTNVCIIGAGIGGLSIGSLLAREGINVTIFEKLDKVGGRTASIKYRNHLLDNGFHIMPFYKKSAIYKILKILGIEKNLRLAKVTNIAFYDGKRYYKYPKGIIDILTFSLVSFKNRLQLLKVLLPLAFATIEKTEAWDTIPLTHITQSLDNQSKFFFDAVCMLAFADKPEHISLGEFARTIIRANPFRGGTSEFGYPAEGGYDTIAKILARYIDKESNTISSILLDVPIKKVVVQQGEVKGLITSDDNFVESNCVVISYPAYSAINQLFDPEVFDNKFVQKVNKLNKTTSVIEVHFALSKKIEEQLQVVFPVGKQFIAKGIFFISNISSKVSPDGQQLVLTGTPVSSEDAINADRIRKISQDMKENLSTIYYQLNERNDMLWERPMAWQLVESVVKEPGLVWKDKMPHEVKDQVKGLFFVGDSTVSYGIGTDSAAHSALLCYEKVLSYLFPE
jgi:protoporphyrinogen oxidase